MEHGDSFTGTELPALADCLIFECRLLDCLLRTPRFFKSNHRGTKKTQRHRVRIARIRLTLGVRLAKCDRALKSLNSLAICDA